MASGEVMMVMVFSAYDLDSLVSISGVSEEDRYHFSSDVERMECFAAMPRIEGLFSPSTEQLRVIFLW